MTQIVEDESPLKIVYDMLMVFMKPMAYVPPINPCSRSFYVTGPAPPSAGWNSACCNAETPNYKAKVVTFEESLRSKLQAQLSAGRYGSSGRYLLGEEGEAAAPQVPARGFSVRVVWEFVTFSATMSSRSCWAVRPEPTILQWAGDRQITAAPPIFKGDAWHSGKP